MTWLSLWALGTPALMIAGWYSIGTHKRKSRWQAVGKLLLTFAAMNATAIFMYVLLRPPR